MAVGEGLEDAAWWRRRQDDHLAAATRAFVPSSPLNLIDHLERARRDPGHRVDWAAVDGATLARWFVRIDGWLDCADFDVLRLLLLWHGYRDELPERVAGALADRFRTFRYWYTDPVDVEATDERWYWSENHRLIFHTCEHLAGQALPADAFTVTGLTGDEHRIRATASLHRWFDEKATDGFSEWHSDVYYAKDLAPLVALADLAADVEVASRAAAFLDLLLYDLSLHTHRGNTGVTHGRSYMKDKSRASDQPVFGAVKLCFDTTTEPWPLDDGDDADLLPRNESATVLARATRYRPPAVLRRIASWEGEMLDEEVMGTPIDPSEPLRDDPVRADGLSYTDPDLVPFWWDRSALTPWQLVPLTIETIERHGLWESNLFSIFRVMRDAMGADPDLWRRVAADLHTMVNAGLLSEVHTCTWRNAHGMLSTAQAYRPGATGFQHHAWQATLDERAVVFTTHPGNPPSPDAGDHQDGDRYWTGSATLPRAVQHRRVAIVCYEPAHAAPELDLFAPFAYLPLTHAFFPTECFDDVRSDGHWTVGRRRDGYVGLWSWRRPSWIDHDPTRVFTNGLTGPFDLVADGGADNVWIVELGDASTHGSFDAFTRALVASEPEVDDPGWGGDGPHPGFGVRHRSPSEGMLALGAGVDLSVDGTPVTVHGDHRFRNPWSTVRRGETTVPIRDADGGWVLDLARGTRLPLPAPS